MPQLLCAEAGPLAPLIVVHPVRKDRHLEGLASGLLFLRADGSQRVEHAVLEGLGGGQPEAWVELQQAVEDVDEALVLDRRKLCSDVAFLRLVGAGVLLLLSKR